MKSRVIGAALVAGLLALLAADSWCAFQVFRLSRARAAMKMDYGEANAVEYGLLSVDLWMKHVRRLAAHEIEHFRLTPRERQAAHAQLEQLLTTLIDRLQQAKPQSLKGKLGKAAITAMAPRQQVPALADDLLERADKPETRRQLEQLVLDKLDDLAAHTRDTTTHLSDLDHYFAKYRVHDRHELDRVITTRAAALQRRAYAHTFALVGSMVLVLLAWLLVQRRPERASLQTPLFVAALALALVALLSSLASPMIEVDARIRRVDFVLLGEHLRFDNQVLFYQSKSILQVVWTLLRTHQADSMFVGALILMFSILLPMTKLICTYVVLLGGARARRSRLLQILAFKTGKWSMADVLVVAIFMAYVGFKAILDSQLQDMNVSTPSLSSITTNDTALQPAFVLFTAFVLFGLVLAELIKRAAARAPQSI